MNLKDLPSVIAGLSTADRPIRLRLSHSEGMLEDVLMIQRVTGSESVCGGLEYQLHCVATNASLPLKEFIAVPVEIQFVTDTGGLRSVCGIVSQAAAGQSDGGLASYQLVVRDALALMEQRVNTRVFRSLNEVDITKVILDEWRQSNSILGQSFDVDWSLLQGSYPAREFTMQHNESDAAFLRRLWKRRGIAWSFRPGKANGNSDVPAHTLVLFDNATLLPENAAGTVQYHRDDATEARDSITAWQPVRTLTAGSIHRHSWDYMAGRATDSQINSVIDQGSNGNAFAASLDDYVIDMPHAADSAEDYAQLGKLRMQRHEYQSKCFHGKGSVRDFCAGQWFTLIGQAEIDTHPQEERQFILTELHIEAENNLPTDLHAQIQKLTGSATDSSTSSATQRYRNRFTCVRRSTPIVPAFDPRTDLPRPQLQSAIVVGPEGEEVHCDEHGRVKIRFTGTKPEDHAHAQGAGANSNDTDSAWVRVASSWASNQWGAISLPRIGDEVLVDFLSGDPDKPVIVGQVYMGNKAPTFSQVGNLPGNKYLAGIKSKEVQGNRYNQLRLDDTPSQINAQLASEHAHSQLNLGFLTHPRQDGKGEARGEGAELRSDGAVAVRAAKLLLLTTQSMLQAQGNQLEREPLQQLLEASQGLLEALGPYAEQHQAMAVDMDAHKKITADLKSAEQGSNTQANGTEEGGAPLIAEYAAGGFATATPYSSVSYSGQQHNLLAQQHVQVVAGERYNLNAGQGVSVFAHKNGIKHIAHYGKFDIQAQHDSIGIAADQDVNVTASQGEVVIAAKKSITLACGGAYIKIGDGKIDIGCGGGFTVNASTHTFTGPASKNVDLPYFPAADHTNWLKLDLDGYEGAAMAGVPYTLHLADGQKKKGTLDGNGLAEEKNLPQVVSKVEYHNDPAVKDEARPPLDRLLADMDPHIAQEPNLVEPQKNEAENA